MFDSNAQFREGDKLYNLYMDVRASLPPHKMFQFWMAEVARDMLRLGVYFHAMGVMLQVPGAVDCDWYGDEGEISDLLSESTPDTVMDVLAACLDSVGAPHLMKQIPGWTSHRRADLPDVWQEFIDKMLKVEHGVLNVIAACLDELMVGPGMAEINQDCEKRWWHRWQQDR